MSMCPYCNALATLSVACPNCHTIADDQGMLANFYSDYSPYRERDDINMSNGFDDVQNHQCVHLLYCPGCQHEFTYSVNEID